MIDETREVSLNPPAVSRALSFIFILIIGVTLSSCVEGEEEIWINADASGRLRAHYEIPAIALRQMADPEDIIRALRKVDEKEDGLKITALSFETHGSKAIFHLEGTFKNARELLEISARNAELFVEEASADPEQMDVIAGDIEFAIEGLTPSFSRSVSLDGLFPSFISNRPKMLGSSNFKYTIHLPAKVKESNAHSISNNGRTVSWTFLLKEHFEKPMQMSFTTELPIPWWVWLILSLCVFALAWLLWRKFLSPKLRSPQRDS